MNTGERLEERKREEFHIRLVSLHATLKKNHPGYERELKPRLTAIQGMMLQYYASGYPFTRDVMNRMVEAASSLEVMEQLDEIILELQERVLEELQRHVKQSQMLHEQFLSQSEVIASYAATFRYATDERFQQYVQELLTFYEAAALSIQQAGLVIQQSAKKDK